LVVFITLIQTYNNHDHAAWTRMVVCRKGEVE
jgi:hypothetical protein